MMKHLGYIKFALIGLLGFFVFAAAASATPELTEVDVIRYAVFCPKLRQEVKALELKGVINNYCVLKTQKMDGRLKKVFKQNRYRDLKKYSQQVQRITAIHALIQLQNKKIDPKLKGVFKSYLPSDATGNYQVYLKQKFSESEVELVKKHSEALILLAR